MPLLKITNFFEGRSHGWTESYFAGFATNDLGSAYVNIALPIANDRAQLLGDPCYIKAIRVSVERNDDGTTVLRDSYLQYVKILPAFGSAEVTRKLAADSDVALQVIWQNATNQLRKFIFLRGIWDDVETAGGEYVPVGSWNGRLNNWRATLFAKSVGWDSKPQFAKTIITNYATDAGNHITLTLAGAIFGNPPVGLPYPYTQVRISKLNNKSVLNGLLTVLPLSPNTCITVAPIAAGPFISPGTLTTYSHLFIPAANIRAQKIVTRKAGAPLLESRGRVRAKPKV